MEMPKNYAETRTSGDFTPITLGGHHLIIKQVNESKSKSGKAMIVVLFDMATNDSQPGYMTEEFMNDIRPEKKWPHVGTQYILTEDGEGKCSKSFKSFVTAFERSNNTGAIWGDKFAAQFKNKKIGGVFGEVENEYNGKTTMRHELRWFCDDSKVDSASIPAPKMLNGSSSPSAPNTKDNASDFMPVEDAGEEIPWG